jgi:hypothetical protein
MWFPTLVKMAKIGHFYLFLTQNAKVCVIETAKQDDLWPSKR